jgi:hypothetical protein
MRTTERSLLLTIAGFLRLFEGGQIPIDAASQSEKLIGDIFDTLGPDTPQTATEAEQRLADGRLLVRGGCDVMQVAITLGLTVAQLEPFARPRAQTDAERKIASQRR